MSKVKELEGNFEVIAGQVAVQKMMIESIIVEAIRSNVTSEKEIMIRYTKAWMLSRTTRTWEVAKSSAPSALSPAPST